MGESATIALAVARGLHDCGVISTFGVLVARAAAIVRPSDAWFRLLQGSVGLAWVTASVWLVLQASEMAGATTASSALTAAPVVLFHTGFGHALLLRLGLLSAAALLPWRGAAVPALVAAGLACVAQIRMGHAAAPDGPWQAPAAALHMLAVGAWIGGLPPLAIGLGSDPVRAARRFSLIGLAAVVVLAVTALVQASLLVGGLPGLLGTVYGHVAVIKTGLFALLLGLAALNRWWLSPALKGLNPERAVARLRRSIALEAALGVATVLAAAYLATLAPGAHETPSWPLSWRLSWDALDDPDVVAPLWRACGLLALALLTVLAARGWGRRRNELWLVSASLAAIAVWLVIPRLGAFAVPANPFSFVESPTGFTKLSVGAGAAVYRRNCYTCHGARGFGDGPLAAGLPIAPTPLTGFHLLQRSDGDMFWLISRGLSGDVGPVMPGFEATLSETERWAVIDYVRTLAGAEPGDVSSLTHHHH